MALVKHAVRAALLVTAAAAAFGSAQAAEVRYEAIDLPDATLGQDLWSMHYTLTGDFSTFAGLTLLYAAGAYTQLTLATAPDAGAFATTLAQPDAALGADGLLSLSANRGVVGEAHRFDVNFVRLGSAAPGAQPFELFDANFSITGGGATLPLTPPPVPEPTSAALLMLGLVAGLGRLAAQRRQRERTRGA